MKYLKKKNIGQKLIKIVICIQVYKQLFLITFYNSKNLRKINASYNIYKLKFFFTFSRVLLDYLQDYYYYYYCYEKMINNYSLELRPFFFHQPYLFLKT